MEDNRIIVQSAKSECYFERCYHNFMDSKLLDGTEKIVFLALKRFLDVKADSGDVYPKIETLCEMLSYSNKTVIKTIKSLIKKGIIKKKQQGLNKPNIYKIIDSADIWKSEKIENIKAAIEEIEENQMIELLTAKGYIVSKKRGLESDTDQSTQTSTHHKNYKNNTTDTQKSQAEGQVPPEPQPIERYPMDRLKAIYDYSTLIASNPNYQEDIDVILDIIYDTVNSTAQTVKVGKEIKPIEVVSSRLLKLDQSDLMYAIDTYHKQTDRIKNTRSYMLTLLYHAKDQAHLDLSNLGHNKGDF